MHSGFQALRNHMPMHCRASFPGVGRTPEVLADIARIIESWRDCRTRFGAGGPFLFGTFSHRRRDVRTGGPAFQNLRGRSSTPSAARTLDAILALPAMQQWLAEAEAETEVIPDYEP